MTNKERYKEAFSVLHTSHDLTLEVEKMKRVNRRHSIKIAAAIVTTCLIVVGGSGIAYACDLGGIQRTIQLWIHGDQTEVTMDFSNDGSYSMSYQDEEGNTVERGGGGVAIEEDGSERALTEEELLDHLNDPEVEYEDDGSVWVYYNNQKTEITDKFKDDVCYVTVTNGEETLYMTIQYKNGWSTSPHKYLEPDK